MLITMRSALKTRKTNKSKSIEEADVPIEGARVRVVVREARKEARGGRGQGAGGRSGEGRGKLVRSQAQRVTPAQLRRLLSPPQPVLELSARLYLVYPSHFKAVVVSRGIHENGAVGQGREMGLQGG